MSAFLLSRTCRLFAKGSSVSSVFFPPRLHVLMCARESQRIWRRKNGGRKRKTEIEVTSRGQRWSSQALHLSGVPPPAALQLHSHLGQTQREGGRPPSSHTERNKIKMKPNGHKNLLFVGITNFYIKKGWNLWPCPHLIWVFKHLHTHWQYFKMISSTRRKCQAMSLQRRWRCIL